MIQFDVTSNLGETLPRKEHAVFAAVEAALNAQLTAEQDVIVDDALAGGVLQRRSGKLAASVRLLEAAITGDTFSGSIEAGGADAPYAAFQEFGTDRWYDIVPARRKALAWEGEDGTIFAKHVHHPPIRERSFLRSTHTQQRTQFANRLAQAVAEALQS